MRDPFHYCKRRRPLYLLFFRNHVPNKPKIMDNKTYSQLELFDAFLKVFLSPNTCIICLSGVNVKEVLSRLPGEEFFSYRNLCNTCRDNPITEVK